MQTTMNPCPVCDFDKLPDVVFVETEGYESGRVCVQCQNCGFSSPSANSDYGAVAVWNSICQILRKYFIRDNDGKVWHVYDEKIRLLGADLEPTDNDEVEMNGYTLCGKNPVSILKEYGYIK